MSFIHQDVQNEHLRQFPQEQPIANRFALDFDVTWATRRTAYNTDFSAYVVRPSPTIREQFGFGLEMALFVFDYPTLQARTFQGINQVIQESPLDGRVEPSTYFLVSRADDAVTWTMDYLSRNPQVRNPIPIPISRLTTVATPDALRAMFAEHVYRRDLFDYRQPLILDTYFFGREALVSKLRDNIKNNQNSGLFGLRKTGKTSLLFKLLREAKGNKFAKIFYFDCQSPSIRQRRSIDLIDYINKQLIEQSQISSKSFDKLSPYDAFPKIVKTLSKAAPVCLIFDEIEYISPFAKTDDHWRREFVDLWQLIRSVQSSGEGLSFIIGGVNASVCEAPVFDGIHNPLFSMVKVDYVQGLDPDSLVRMIGFIGPQMGLKFSDEAINALSSHYGGHPLLTRLACSFIHKRVADIRGVRPYLVQREFVERLMIDCDASISPYCAHVVSELREFYRDEYDVLSMAAIGLRSEFLEFGSEVDFVGHLVQYGITSVAESGLPRVQLPVLQAYLRREYCRVNRTKIPRELIEGTKREQWVRASLSQILRELSLLLRNLPLGDVSPFGKIGISEFHTLSELPVADTKDQFSVFIFKMYKAFYESIGGAPHAAGYFSGDFKANWSALFDAIYRIKIYRDFVGHAEVSGKTLKALQEYLALDIGGASPDTAPSGWFALQQAVIDELLCALLTEAAKRDIQAQ